MVSLPIEVDFSKRAIFFPIVWVVILLAVPVCSQTHFTLPSSVWRFTLGGATGRASWIRGDRQQGYPDEFFTLNGYGKRYYDHLLPTSDEDLVGLGDIYISAFDRVDRVIRDFNASSSAQAWGDTLADFTRDFFGPDSVELGGYITNNSRERVDQGARFTLEYGLTDRITFSFTLPYFVDASLSNEWGWKNPFFSENADPAGFLEYHQANKEKFEDFMASEYFGSLDDETAENLQTVYSAFYTPGGRYSVLWALDGGTDPFANGIYGARFNPFSDQDTVATTIDSILAFYHPDRRSRGLGDVQWGLNILLWGSPAWAGESVFSVYGGVGMIVPTGRIIQAFDPDRKDESGRPEQFNELPLGDGVTRWRFSLFGEFYRNILRRLVRINWRAESMIALEGKFWPRLTPRGLFTVDHAMMLDTLGDVYRLKLGDVFTAEAVAFLELVPHRLSVTAGQAWLFKERDRYYADSKRWNSWMAGGNDERPGYDTREFMVTQKASLILHNIHPLKKFGPIPFELELEGTVPIVTRYGWSRFSLTLEIALYFQFW
ncbi:MAG: hypothetical protein ACE5HZ_07865 [Fidelibacterota bacterium]